MNQLITHLSTGLPLPEKPILLTLMMAMAVITSLYTTAKKSMAIQLFFDLYI